MVALVLLTYLSSPINRTRVDPSSPVLGSFGNYARNFQTYLQNNLLYSDRKNNIQLGTYSSEVLILRHRAVTLWLPQIAISHRNFDCNKRVEWNSRIDGECRDKGFEGAQLPLRVRVEREFFVLKID